VEKSINKVILIGRVGNQPEQKNTSLNTKYVSISLATSDEWHDKNTNEKKSNTEWHKVVFFGKSAEAISSYANKGDRIYVEGKINSYKYFDEKSGVEKTSFNIKADSFLFLNNKNQKELKNSADNEENIYSEEDIPF